MFEYDEPGVRALLRCPTTTMHVVSPCGSRTWVGVGGRGGVSSMSSQGGRRVGTAGQCVCVCLVLFIMPQQGS